MSSLYSIRVAERPANDTLILAIQVVHPDAMYIPDTPGFALMLLHDTAGSDDPLAREVDLSTTMDSEWASANARAFIAEVELVSTQNEPPEQAEGDYEHAYWQRPKGWLKGKLRIRVTHPAWMRHVSGSWDSASFNPTSYYEDCDPASPDDAHPVELEGDHERSAGFLPVPRLRLDHSYCGPECPELVWSPRYGARAYAPGERLAGMQLRRETLAPWLGLPILWAEGDGSVEVGILTGLSDDGPSLVCLSPSSSSMSSPDFDSLAWIARAQFRRGMPRLGPALTMEGLLTYADPVASIKSVEGRRASIVIRTLMADEAGVDCDLSLDKAGGVLRLITIPAKDAWGDFDEATARLGQAARREMHERELDWGSELYPQIGRGFIESFSLGAKPQPREIDLDELDGPALADWLRSDAWPKWELELVASDEAWVEHLQGAKPWNLDTEELEDDDDWDDEPRTWQEEDAVNPDDDDDDDDDDEPAEAKSTQRRRFELPAGARTQGEALEPGDPRIVLRDHGMWEQLGHPETRDNFHEACKLGNLEVVEAYIALGIDLNLRADISEETPLVRAAEGNQPAVARALIAAGADHGMRDGSGDTAIMTAINWGSPEVLEALIAAGADPDHPDTYDNYPLVKAIEEDADELIRILCEGGASPTAGLKTGDCALQWCLNNGHEERIDELLALEACDLSAQTAHGDSLLALAIEAGDVELLSKLLDTGVPLDTVNRWGHNAADLARAKDQDACVELLAERGLNPACPAVTDYFKALSEGEREDVEAALDGGVALDARSHEGAGALHEAVSSDHVELVELLHARGVDMNALDANGDNALAHADDTELRMKLLALGVAPSVQRPDGSWRHPALEAALDDADDELLQAILGAGGDLSDLCAANMTMIWGEYEDEQRAETLRALAEAGADLRAPSERELEPLLVGFINRSQQACAEALIELAAAGKGKVDVDGADKSHVTPLHKSCGEYDDHEMQGVITTKLLAAGADYTKTDWQGDSPWDEASDGDNEHCVAALEAVFEQTLRDALADAGHDPDPDPDAEPVLDGATFTALAARTNRETLRHWVRKGEHEIVEGLMRAGVSPNFPAVNEHGLRPGNLPLNTAISAKDRRMVEILLAGGADPNIELIYGSSALGYALSDHDLDMIELILEAGADPNRCDDSGNARLYSAKSVEELEMCARYGASAQPFPCGRTPLLGAIRGSSFECAQWLLAHGAHIDARGEGRVTALHVAIDEDEVELALALLAAGADPNVQTSDEDRTTPLIRACKKGDAELVAALLEAGADPDVADASGESARDYAGYREELRALFGGGQAKQLERIERPLPPLLRAVIVDDRDGFAAALEQAKDGGALDVASYRGDTALMLAAGRGHRQMVEALLDAGATLEAKNAKGVDAWCFAFASGQEAMRDLLEQRGLANSMDRLNQMAGLSMRWDAGIAAIEAGDLAAVSKQIDALDFDVNSLGRGRRPLALAIAREDQAMVELLMAKGADPSLPLPGGQTLADMAAGAGFGELLED